MIVDDQQQQRDVIGFLSRPETYGLPETAKVETIETHISVVFLAGDRVFKLKRAVTYPYLDFSTLALRHAACEAELVLNRRTAPDLYLGVRKVARGAGGTLALDGPGPAADWVVEMRRFDQDALLDRMAARARGALTPALMRDLADAAASFHRRAESSVALGGARGIADLIGANDDAFLALDEPVAGAAALAALRSGCYARLGQVAELLDRRRAEGRVRRCHGDLHLRNICLLDGKPVPFDCIEFSEAIATTDTAYDLAFLLMDLCHRGLRDLASVVLNRYIDVTGDESCLAAMPLFMALRAAVRAHVTAAATAEGGATPEAAAARRAEARSYLDLALDLLKGPTTTASPRLVAVGGLSGTGKSTLAAALAPKFGGPAPGARVLRSDVIRKRLCGVPPEKRLPPAAYDPAMTRKVYATQRALAAAALAAGYDVVADAVFARPDERAAIEDAARAVGATFQGIWLAAPRETLTARLDGRTGDASDATAETAGLQAGYDLGRVAWPTVDAGGSPAATLQAALPPLGLDDGAEAAAA
jgi:hypothetical protein